MGIHDVYPTELIEKAAEALKKVEAVKAPVWARFIKTGVHKERAPLEKDWWYMRAAAVLRSVAVLGPIGVAKLRTKYGGKKRRGHQPAIFKKGSGSIIRKVLQQLDKAGFTKFEEKGIHKGRIVTKEGKLFLNKIADEIAKSKPKVEEPKKKVPKKEVKVVEKKEVAEVPKKEIEVVKKKEIQEVKEEKKEVQVVPKKEIAEVPKKEVKPEEVKEKPKEKKPEEKKQIEEK